MARGHLEELKYGLAAALSDLGLGHVVGGDHPLQGEVLGDWGVGVLGDAEPVSGNLLKGLL